MDITVGGPWRNTMHGPDGKLWPNWIRYTEISAAARIAYDHGGEMDEPAHFGGIIPFEDSAGNTRVLLCLVFETAQALDATIEFGAVEGGRQTLTKLEGYMLGQQELRPSWETGLF